MNSNNKKIKILVMRYRFIGDTLLTVPFLRNLRYAYPEAQIDMLVAPVSGEIIEKCPYVDNFIYFDTTKKHRYENKEGQKKKTFWTYVKLLREQKYDKAYVLKRSFSSAFLAFAAGIKERIGFNTEGRGFLLTKRVKYEENRHEIDCFLDVLKADGIEVKDNYLENRIDEEESAQMREFLNKSIAPENQQLKKVIVHATSGNRKKEWDKQKWAQVVTWLANEKNAQVLFNGTKNDSQTYEEIMSYVREDLKVQPLNLCGNFNLRQTLAFTSECDLIVGCDSGNLHIAASVGVPVVAIFGPMNPVKWKPATEKSIVVKTDLPCQPCGLKKGHKCGRDYQCLRDISVDTVKSAINNLSEKNS